MNAHPNDPLHGYTLEIIITRLVEEYGWDELSDRIRIRCFANDPSIKSTLTFLRKTPWARNKIEQLFIQTLEQQNREI
ncbi:MAG: VF530 family DNA-binding protein [Luteolibacter sp.]